MKKIKKLLAITMAAILAMSIGIVSLAAGETHTITIQNSASGHTYEAYQIFTGDFSETKNTLSNIEWGSGVNGDNLLAALKEADAGVYGSCEDAEDVAEILGKNQTLDNDQAKAFAKIAAKYLTTPKATSTYHTPNYRIEGLDDGYYLIKDKNGVEGADAHTEYILKVTNNETVEPKSDVPKSYKKVKDINDSTDTEYTDWQDSADYDIGDRIPFQLTATLPDNYSEYETYAMTFHDTEAQGLKFDSNSVKVYVNDVLIKQGYTVVTDGLSEGVTFEIRFTDLKATDTALENILINHDSTIRVEYESVLSDNAVLGSAGNPNTMYLTYSNNPYGEGTGTTPKDTVIVFTYQTIIHKKDENKVDLDGAEFTLEKEIAENQWEKVTRVTKEDDHTFTFKGLDDGNYRLKETTTPDGYNTMEPVYFTITAEHEIESDNPRLTSLSGTSFADPQTGTIANIKFTTVLDNGSLSADVINESGTILPGTGGIGTTIFYGAGIILIAGAAVLITVRVKKSRK